MNLVAIDQWFQIPRLLLMLFPYDTKRRILYARLKVKLKRLGVNVSHLSDDEITHRLRLLRLTLLEASIDLGSREADVGTTLVLSSPERIEPNRLLEELSIALSQDWTLEGTRN
jgi:hypothetical protein